MIENDSRSNALRMTTSAVNTAVTTSSNCSSELGVTYSRSGRPKGFQMRSTPWWNRKSRLEKSLLALSSISLLICITLILVLVSTLPYASVKGDITNIHLHVDDQSSVCLTPGCISIAAEYLQSANLSANPCEDFYNFACGQFEANTAIPDHEHSTTSFQSAEDHLNNRLKSVLDEAPDGGDNKVFKKVRGFYTACMNRTEINILKGKPLEELLSKLGEWPAVKGRKWSSEAEKNFEWTEMIYKLRQFGISHNILVDLSVSVNSLNSSTYSIEVDEPTLGMPGRNYLLRGINDTLVQKYLQFMVETTVLLGANYETAEKELTESLQFEIDLANFTLPKEERRNFTRLYNKKTLRELNEIAPFVNWVDYANRLLMEKVNENEVVVLISPSYLRNLTVLLQKTPKRTLANYLMSRVAMSVLGMLDDRFRSSWLTYFGALTGQTVDDLRWRICLAFTRTHFGNAIGAMYVRRYLDEKARKIALTLVHDVRQEFKSILKQIDWMDTVTLGRAIEKANAMSEMIAYPLELLNDTALEDHYRNINVAENKFFESALKIKKEWADYRYGKLRQTNKRTDWRDIGSVAIVNAYYSPSQNLIMFPAGILQGVFFDSDRPNYVNYGAIGFVIGHEITHGFDDQGRQFDEIGNLKGWWEPETDLKFQNKTQCIIEQYNVYNMTDVNMTVNGINTQGENIADNGGVKEAYQAYQKWVAENGEEDPLPGLNLTSRQIFWMSFANVWCSKTRPEAMTLRILTGVHSPQKFRVNGVVSNSPEFAGDFQCPIGSPMNPHHKCVVW